MEKYGTTKQAKGANIIWRMRNSCWIIKGTDTEYVKFVTFTREQWQRRTLLNVTFTSTFPVLLNLNFYHSEGSIIKSTVKMHCRIRQLCIIFVADSANIV